MFFFPILVTVEGKVYACGEATNGRLGLGISSGTVPIPRQITALSNYVVKKVAVHSGTGYCYAYIHKQNILSLKIEVVLQFLGYGNVPACCLLQSDPEKVFSFFLNTFKQCA